MNTATARASDAEPTSRIRSGRKNALSRSLFDRAGFFALFAFLAAVIAGPSLSELHLHSAGRSVFAFQVITGVAVFLLALAAVARGPRMAAIGWRSLGRSPAALHPFFWLALFAGIVATATVRGGVVLPMSLPLLAAGMAWFAVGYWCVSRRNAAALWALVTVVYVTKFHFAFPSTAGLSVLGPVATAAYLFSPVSAWTLFAVVAALPVVLNLVSGGSAVMLGQVAVAVSVALLFPETRRRAGRLVAAGLLCWGALALGLFIHRAATPSPLGAAHDGAPWSMPGMAAEPSISNGATVSQPSSLFERSIAHEGTPWAPPMSVTEPDVVPDYSAGPKGLVNRLGVAGLACLALFTLSVFGHAVWRSRRAQFNTVGLFWLSVFLSSAIGLVMNGGLDRPLTGFVFWFSAGLAFRGTQPRPLRPKGRWVFLVHDLRSGALQRAVSDLVTRSVDAQPRNGFYLVVREKRGAIFHDLPVDVPVTPLYPKGKNWLRTAFQYAEWIAYQWIHRPDAVIAIGRRMNRFALAAAPFSPSPKLIAVELSALGLKDPLNPWEEYMPVSATYRAISTMADRRISVPPGRPGDLRGFLHVPERRTAPVEVGSAIDRETTLVS